MPALLLLAIFLFVMYAVMIRPQQKRARDHQALIAATQVGDEVMTTAGIFGTVTAVEGDVVSIEIAPGTVMRVARAAIGRRMNAELDEYEAGETFDDIDDELGESVADETAAADDTAPSNGHAPPPVAPSSPTEIAPPPVAPSPPTEIPPPPAPAPEVPPAPETPPPGVGPSSGEPA